MYHSITYGDKNTWEDWKLVPSSRPFFAPPGLKTKYVDIPGRDGKVDLTEVERGYPSYNNRTGSHEFIVVNDFYEPVETADEWYVTYSKVMEYINGKVLRAYLDDDPYYYYEGRFSVSGWKNERMFSRITINYDVKPYKTYIYRSDANWIWDTFNFQNGVITTSLFDMAITDTDEHEFIFDRRTYGPAPVNPILIVSDDPSAPTSGGTFTIQVENVTGLKTYTITGAEFNYEQHFSDLILAGPSTKVKIKYTPASTPYRIDSVVKLIFYRGAF